MSNINKQNDFIIKLAFDQYMRDFLVSIPSDLDSPPADLTERVLSISPARRFSRRLVILVAAIVLLVSIAVSVCIAYQWPYPRRGRSFDMSISSTYNATEQSELTFTRPEGDRRVLPRTIDTVYIPQDIPEGWALATDMLVTSPNIVIRYWDHGKYTLSYRQIPIESGPLMVASAKHAEAEYFDMDGFHAVYITHTSKSKYTTGNTLIWNDGKYAYSLSDEVTGRDTQPCLSLFPIAGTNRPGVCRCPNST